MVTITQLPGDWREVNTRLQNVRRRLQRSGFAFEWCYSVEANPRATGHHAHLLVHGPSSPPAAAWTAHATHAGFGMVHVQETRPTKAWWYLMKSVVTSEDLPLPAAEVAIAGHLVLNGGRLINASRQFWRDTDGRVLPGMAAAVAVCRTGHSQQDDEWIVVPEAFLDRYLIGLAPH